MKVDNYRIRCSAVCSDLRHTQCKNLAITREKFHVGPIIYLKCGDKSHFLVVYLCKKHSNYEN